MKDLVTTTRSFFKNIFCPGELHNVNIVLEIKCQLLQVTAGLFDALSNNSDVDHPLCEECTDSILELMDHQLRLTENEQSDYREYLQR